MREKDLINYIINFVSKNDSDSKQDDFSEYSEVLDELQFFFD